LAIARTGAAHATHVLALLNEAPSLTAPHFALLSSLVRVPRVPRT
jgi:hypothetical protein